MHVIITEAESVQLLNTNPLQLIYYKQYCL